MSPSSFEKLLIFCFASQLICKPIKFNQTFDSTQPKLNLFELWPLACKILRIKMASFLLTRLAIVGKFFRFLKTRNVLCQMFSIEITDAEWIILKVRSKFWIWGRRQRQKFRLKPKSFPLDAFFFHRNKLDFAWHSSHRQH